MNENAFGVFLIAVCGMIALKFAFAILDRIDSRKRPKRMSAAYMQMADDNRKAAENISRRYPRAAVKNMGGTDGFFLVDGMTEAEAGFVAFTLNNMRSI